jgi:DNA-binding transcriptional MerR regulator
MRKTLPALALAIVLSGCFGDTVIDTSSVEDLNESVRDMGEELQLNERLRFEAAVQTMIEATRKEGMSLEEVATALETQIGGKTAVEVIAIAEAWTAAEEKRIAEEQRQQKSAELSGKIEEYTAEIARLEKLIVEQKAHSEKVLGEFTLSNQRYFWRGPSQQEYPVIDVELTNNHSQPIEMVVIEGVLRKAGEDKPLVEGQLRYEFPARLQPGKTKKMRFEPDLYGDWAKRELMDREDLELSVDLLNVTYPGGKELIRTYVYRGDDPVIQVESLKRRLGDAMVELKSLATDGAATGS